jgi:hypothetical protein
MMSMREVEDAMKTLLFVLLLVGLALAAGLSFVVEAGAHR